MIWHIGCSGFYYKHWKGRFYPEGLPQKKWFDFYCEHFSTLELNVTFYRFPQLAFLQNWHEKSPPGFKFAVKAPRAITHFKLFKDCEQMLADFYGTIDEGLQEKLGPVLFQLPPRLKQNPELLERIIHSLDPKFAHVIEFRNESWWTSEVIHRLSAAHITFCGMSHPQLPQEVIANNPVLYYRYHGIPQLYLSPYSREQLAADVEEIQSSGVKEAYIYFNNDITAAAIDNAKEMIVLAAG